MDYELTTKKQADGTQLVKNKLTNEPVAILKSPKYSYRKNEVQAEWHPDFKLLHPEVVNNLLHRNFHKNFESASAATNVLTHKSESFVRGHGFETDPIETEYAGTGSEMDSSGQEKTVHKWHIFDGDDRVGTMSSPHDPNTIHRESPVKVTWNPEYLQHNEFPQSVREAAAKKHPSTNLESTMNRVRYLLDNRQKEPRFIGTTKSSWAEHNVFKTNLNPEEASKAYEEHMKNTPAYREHTFTRHSPVAFMAHKPASHAYDASNMHHVIAMPGEVHHMSSRTAHPDYGNSKKNTQVIESVEQFNANPVINQLTLEDYLFVKSI